MRVIVDFDLCDGMGLCMAAAPTVFEVQEDGFLQVLEDHPSEAEREGVVEAARRCPRRAISVEG